MTTPTLSRDWLRPIVEAKQDAQTERAKLCTCREYKGDSADCPFHGKLYQQYREDVEFGSPEWFAALPEESF